MIVIAEGIDRVGKTTFCRELSKDTYWPIYKHDNKQFDYKLMDNMNETDKMLQLLDLYDSLNEQLVVGSGIIFDRFHFSDFAYGCSARKDYNESVAFDNFISIEKRLLAMQETVVLVLMYDSKGTMRASIEHGSNLDEIDKSMKRLYKASKLRKMMVEYKDILKAIDAIGSAASNLEDKQNFAYRPTCDKI